MFSKGLLYVRIRNEIVDQLVYLKEDWDNISEFWYESLLFRSDYGTVPTFNFETSYCHPEGGYGIYGSHIKFVRATDEYIMSLLNFFNTVHSVNNWIHRVQDCEGLLESEKKRLTKLGMQSDYYNS